jgi:hypothetical protein
MKFRQAANAFSVLLFAVPGMAASAAAQTAFAPHRAVYDVTLDAAEERTGISGMDGRLVFEFDGSSCDGYTMNMRFVLRMQLPDGLRVTDQQTTTFETGDGSEFNFVTKVFTDERLEKEVNGTAVLGKDGVSVELEKPQAGDVALEPSQFPTRHLAELIGRANAGERFYETTLFDGSDDADRLMLTSVVIGAKAQNEAGDGELQSAAPLADMPYWPVTIAYFDPLEETGGEAEPQYRITFKLYENGITRSLEMDYGDFSLDGTMTSLEMLPEPAACEAQ